jgi:hypothetical protein
MFENISVSKECFEALKRESMHKLKVKAMRRGIWFKALNRLDRALYSLTMKVTDVVRSGKLARLLFPIVDELVKRLENRFSFALKEIGYPLARRLSQLAQGWGNVQAEDWMSDSKFARFLAVLHVNNSGVYIN